MSAVIGSRWKPGQVIRRDSDTGFYEQLNSDMNTATENIVQRALLARSKPIRRYAPWWLRLWRYLAQR